jgi:hypothetical protein
MTDKKDVVATERENPTAINGKNFKYKYTCGGSHDTHISRLNFETWIRSQQKENVTHIGACVSEITSFSKSRL